MEHFVVNSTLFDHVYYEDGDRRFTQNGDLLIRFCNGIFLRYKEVPKKVFQAFSAVKSKIQFFHDYIRSEYFYYPDADFQKPKPEPEKSSSALEDLIKKILTENVQSSNTDTEDEPAVIILKIE